jgi:hypothetical protein
MFKNMFTLDEFFASSGVIKLLKDVNLPPFTLGSVRYVLINPEILIDETIIQTILDMLYDKNSYKATIVITNKDNSKQFKISEPFILTNVMCLPALLIFLSYKTATANTLFNLSVKDFHLADYNVILEIVDININKE